MFNPESFKQKHEIIYGKNRRLYERSDRQVNMRGANPPNLALDLVLDGTGR